MRRLSPVNLSLGTMETIDRHKLPPVYILTSHLHFYFHPLFDVLKFNLIKDITKMYIILLTYMQKENVTILFLSINVLLFDLLLKPSTHYWCSCEEMFCKKTGFFFKCFFYFTYRHSVFLYVNRNRIFFSKKINI